MITRRIFAQALASIGLAAPALAKQSPADAMLEARIAEREALTDAINISTQALHEQIGKTFYFGIGNPSPKMARSGDLYLDSESMVWQKVGVEWVQVQSICGRR